MSFYREDDLLPIAGIQHFHYCERQWALIHVEGLWKEDGRTAKGQVVHNRVHDPSLTHSRKGVVTSYGLMVKCLEHGFYGVCDCVEFIPDENGVEIFGHSGRYRINPVEYKVGRPKKDNLDAVQLCLQCMALEEMMDAKIEVADIYYHETRRRQTHEITESLRSESIRLMVRMHQLFREGMTPMAENPKRCKNCSMKDICLPSVSSKNKTMKYLEKAAEDDS